MKRAGKVAMIIGGVIIVSMVLIFAVATSLNSQAIQKRQEQEQAIRDQAAAAQAEAEKQAEAQKANTLTECIDGINKIYDGQLTAPANADLDNAGRLQYTQTVIQLKNNALQECQTRYGE
jgi:hypothetical protein